MIRYIKFILFPFAGIYWLVTFCRNLLFNIGVKKQASFNIPIISIGNITVGGTGKTPHTQYIVDLLKDSYKLATLSRGYKRSTQGYIDNSQEITPLELGDEPFQLHKRYPTITVSACEKRVEGVEQILDKHKNTDVIILDDAYQHRYIKPGLQILLVDYNRPLWKDFVFPVGFLREGKYARKRADIIIVTKCPQLSIAEQEKWKRKLKSSTTQEIYFSRMAYGKPYTLSHENSHSLANLLEENKALLITGLANASSLHNYLHSFTPFLTHIDYEDHYNYTEEDVKEIISIHARLSEKSKTIIITTEKDIHKLKAVGLLDSGIDVFVIPIEPVFDINSESPNKSIEKYVTRAKRTT